MPAVVDLMEEKQQRKERAMARIVEEFNAMDAEEEVRHQDKLTQWVNTWQEQEAYFATQTSTLELDKDVRRSGLLACGVADGLTVREIAAEVPSIDGKKNSPTYVSYLLRYQRFNGLFTMVNKISERRFRAYWDQCRDAHSTMGRRKPEVVQAYEAKVFPQIAALIQSGTPPAQQEDKPPRLNAKATAAGHGKPGLHTRAVRREIQEIYDRMKEDITRMKGIAGAERARLDPIWIAEHVKRLEKGFMELQKALKRAVGSLVE